MNERECRVLIAMQLALLDEIGPDVRGVSVRWTDETVHFDCYVNGVPSSRDKDSMGVVETEVIAVFPEHHQVTHTIHRLDVPILLPNDLRWVYTRREDA